MTRPARSPWLLAAGVSLVLAGAIWILASPGCGTVGDVAGGLEKATEGSAVSGVFGGIRGLSEANRTYSPAQEHYVGRSVSAQILTRYRVLDDPSLQEYVSRVGLAVLAAPEAARTFSGYRFVVLEGSEVQAVSAPGGFVFLTEGAVRKARDEDELAAVLAHEIAHVSLGHGIGSIREATRKRSYALIAKGLGETAAEAASKDQKRKDLVELTALFGNAVADITTELIEKGYSRDTELAADEAATVYLRSSGYSLKGLRGYLRSIEKGGEGGRGGWLATHPSPADRLAALDSKGLAKSESDGRDVRAARFLAALRIPVSR